MIDRPYLLRWINGKYHWVVLSKNGLSCADQSVEGFLTATAALADLLKRFQ
ncbi:MAG: hypothetical protein WA948_11575 [Pontixanthobacter sp.]